MSLRHLALEHSLELIRVRLADARVLLRNHDIDAVGQISDVRIDPVQLFLELGRCEADGAEDAEPSGLADRYDHVAAVGERKDGDFNT